MVEVIYNILQNLEANGVFGTRILKNKYNFDFNFLKNKLYIYSTF